MIYSRCRYCKSPWAERNPTRGGGNSPKSAESVSRSANRHRCRPRFGIVGFGRGHELVAVRTFRYT